MMKRILVSLTVASAIGTLTLIGCGSSSDSGTPGGGTGSDGGPDATNVNPGDDGGVTPGNDGSTSNDAATGNPPLPDGSVLPHGNLLVPGAALFINGVTSDDFVIYTDSSGSANQAFALSLTAGSQPIALGAVDDGDDVEVSGKVVFLATSSDKNGVGAVSVWTSAASAPVALSTSTFVSQGGYFFVSADGAHVVFLDALSETAQTAAIAVAGTDGTGKTTLVGSVELSDVCFPALGMAGTYAVAAYCEVTDAGAPDPSEPDGGTNPYIGVVSTFAGPTAWTQATIASTVQTVFAVDHGATKVAINGLTGTAIYPIAGGTALPVDANGEIGAITFSPGLFTKDGSHFLYTTNAQALERAATISPASPVELAPAGKFADVFALSPDEGWALGALSSDPQSGNVDLYMSSAATPGTPVTLSSATTAGLDGDPFTADSTHVLFYTGLSNGAGTLNALAVSGTTPATIATNAFTHVGTSAAKIVFNDTLGGVGGNTNGADLKAVDVSTTAAPTLLVTQADPNFTVNTAKTLIVYTWSYTPGASAGLWTLPAP